MAKSVTFWVCVLLAALLVGSPASAEPAPKAPAMPARVARCAPAHIQDIRLPFPTTVDEVRVVVARHSPPRGAATVRVDAGQFDRVMRIHGQTSKRLLFQPALAGTTFHVSLNPVFEAPNSACIERVELVRQGVTMATVRP